MFHITDTKRCRQACGHSLIHVVDTVVVDSCIQALSYNSVSESENEMETRVAGPDGQNRIDNPYDDTRLYRMFLDKVIAKYQQRRSIHYVCTYSYELAVPGHLSAHADEAL